MYVCTYYLVPCLLLRGVCVAVRDDETGGWNVSNGMFQTDNLCSIILLKPI